jgi:hypothetical protein
VFPIRCANRLDTCTTALEETGYWVLDFPAKSLMTVLAKRPRKLLFTLNPDVASLLFGGYSLLVVAE